MTLLQMSYILEVDRCGSMNRAARNLFLSQSALSAAIADVERELGVTIFLRTNRGVVLSREGDEFLGYARQVLMQAELLEQRYGTRSQHRQAFSVSSQHYSFASQAFAKVLRDLGGETYSVTLRETTTYEVIEDVGRLRSEVGVLLVTEENAPVLRRLFREYDLAYTELAEKPSTVYVSMNHPLAHKGEVTEEDLLPYPCVSFEQGRHNALFFSEDISMPAVTPRHILVRDRATANDLTLALNAYQAGSGLNDAEGTEKYPYVSLKLRSERKISLGYIVRRSMLLSPMAQAYIQAMQDYAETYRQTHEI